MSIENVNQFYQIVSRNPELQLQFQFATDEENLVNMAVELGQQHGYSFTKEEVIQAIALAQPSTETTGMVELADEQLEVVAGGGKVSDRIGEAYGSVFGTVTGAGIAGVQAIRGKPSDLGEHAVGGAKAGREIFGAITKWLPF